MICVSGIRPGSLGSGRFIELLMDQSKDEDSIRWILGAQGAGSPIKLIKSKQYARLIAAIFHYFIGKIRIAIKLRSRTVLNEKKIVLFHPQALGLEAVFAFIERRKDPVWVYLLDNGFFCLRSHNHLPEENGACLRCLGNSRGEWKAHGCKPWPYRNPGAVDFIEKLKTQAISGKVKFLAQCETQRQLAIRHFGEQIDVRMVGIWAKDWDVTCQERCAEPKGNRVVFHGSAHPAKGSRWLTTVALHCPEIEFLFPFSVPEWLIEPPANCRFIPMQWESGLSEMISSAKIICVPSLWSAPVEGALVKSLQSSGWVAVRDEPTAFQCELPDEKIIRLPEDPVQAAEFLRRKARGSAPGDCKKTIFLLQTIKQNGLSWIKREFLNSEDRDLRNP